MNIEIDGDQVEINAYHFDGTRQVVPPLVAGEDVFALVKIYTRDGEQVVLDLVTSMVKPNDALALFALLADQVEIGDSDD